MKLFFCYYLPPSCHQKYVCFYTEMVRPCWHNKQAFKLLMRIKWFIRIIFTLIVEYKSFDWEKTRLQKRCKIRLSWCWKCHRCWNSPLEFGDDNPILLCKFFSKATQKQQYKTVLSMKIRLEWNIWSEKHSCLGFSEKTVSKKLRNWNDLYLWF